MPETAPQYSSPGVQDPGPRQNRSQASTISMYDQFPATAKSISFDTRNMPKFVAVPSLVGWTQFWDKFATWYGGNSNKYANDTRSQYTHLLNMCTGDAEHMFLKDHAAEIIARCPEAAAFLNTARTGASALDFARSVARVTTGSSVSAEPVTAKPTLMQLAHKAHEAFMHHGAYDACSSASASLGTDSLHVEVGTINIRASEIRITAEIRQKSGS
jgi:hypothetical protein